MEDPNVYLVVITLLLAIIAWLQFWHTRSESKASQKAYILRLENNLHDLWSDSNKIVLSSNENLQAKIKDFSFVSTVEEMRCAYLYFNELNIICTTYAGWLNGYISEDSWNATMTGILDDMIVDEIAFHCSQKKGYPEFFKEFCRRRRENLLSKKSAKGEESTPE